MSFTGTVKNGVVVLPSDVHWPSGTVVRIEPTESQPPALLDMMNEYDGMTNDLPSDLAANLDHYVHGHPCP